MPPRGTSTACSGSSTRGTRTPIVFTWYVRFTSPFPPPHGVLRLQSLLLVSQAAPQTPVHQSDQTCPLLIARQPAEHPST